MASRWTAFSPYEFGDLPRTGGVYVVFANDSRAYCPRQVLYVGSTNNFARRFGQHGIRCAGDWVATRWGLYADAFVRVRPFQSRLYASQLERRLIRKLRPPFNTASVMGVNRERFVMTASEQLEAMGWN